MKENETKEDMFIKTEAFQFSWFLATMAKKGA
jgi:hypothetical protein